MDPAGPFHILVIEDDADTRANLRDILGLDDYQVAMAGTAAEVLARDDWAKFSAIILDRKLPDARADEFLPTLRQAAPDAAIIVVTGYGDLQGAIAALRQGAADYILKPLNADELRTRIRRITENQRADEARRSAERRYRLLVQNSTDIITAFDSGGTILYQSPSIERLLGHLAEGRIGQNIDRDTIVHPDDQASKRAFLDEALRRPGLPVTAYFRLRHIDGSYRDIEAVGTNLLDDPDFGAIVASYRDITTRKRTEEALSESEAAFRHLVEAADCLIVILRPDRSILYLNPFAERLTGYAAAEVLGRDFFALFLTEADFPAAVEELGRVLSGDLVRDVEIPVLCRVGDVHWVIWNGRRLDDYEGGPAVLGVGQDITGLKRAQERALQTERLAAIGQMVAGLAHESRNALQRSQACLEMLALCVQDRPEAIDLIGRIQKAQDHLHLLFEDVRAYAAPIVLDRRPCHLAEVWREAWSDLEAQRLGRHARLREEIDAPDVCCTIDPFRIGQVFRNLFDNALAAGRDPVEVVVRCEADAIDGHPGLRVAVRDNGPGLSPEQRQRIFEPFYTTKTKGTGLGMAISQRIIDAHGGRIAVAGGPTPGAEIVLTLPRGKL